MTEAAVLRGNAWENSLGKWRNRRRPSQKRNGRCLSGNVFLVLAAGSYLLASAWLRTFDRGRRGGRRVSVLLWCEGRCQLFRALEDTGNTLTDPVTGAPVLVADQTVSAYLFPKGIDPTEEELRRPAQTLERLSAQWDGTRLRLLTYRAVGVDHGLLLAVRADKIEVEGKPFPGKLVALMPGVLEEDVHGLIGMV